MNRASILAGISGHGLRIVSSRWKEIMPPGLTLPAFLRDLSRGFLVFLLRTMDPGLWRIARAKRMTKDGEMDVRGGESAPMQDGPRACGVGAACVGGEA